MIIEVASYLNIKIDKVKEFTGGTNSKVLLLNDTYLIKINEPNQIKAEKLFVEVNDSEYFQKMVYMSKDSSYIVYKFIPGDIKSVVTNSEIVIKEIKKIAESFNAVETEYYGYVINPNKSWFNFLREEVEHSSLNVGEFLDKNIALDAVKELEKYSFTKRMIHGDFGLHNFIFENDKLIGVIDPQSVIGDNLYDIMFAIVSNPSILSNLDIEEIANIIEEDYNKVLNMFKIVFFCRVSRCLKHHKEDFEYYMNYYNNIKLKTIY
ncbi:MAG: phosphotransferase [bacterium]